MTFLEELGREPWRFDFFQAMRRLECAHPHAPRVGTAKKVSDDPVRLGQEPSLAFAPAALHAFAAGQGGRPAHLSVLFFGLFGPNGPLPLHLTEYARERQQHFDDPTLARFLDLFHHRMLELFYRAWASAQPAANFDRFASDPESDRYALYVGALAGLALPSLRDRDSVPDRTKLHYAGHLAGQTRHADGLRMMLQDDVGLPVEITEFVGQWIGLPERYRCRLGESPDTGALGRTAIIGTRLWDRQQKFRIAVGPMDLDDYRRLLPGSPSLQRVVDLVRLYVGDELGWDLELRLRKEQVPPARLGQAGHLGRTSWIASRPVARDAHVRLSSPGRAA